MSCIIVDEIRGINHVDYQSLLRETLPSLNTVQKALIKTYRRRFFNLENSEAGQKNVGRVKAAMHRGLKYLIFLMEFVKLQSIYLNLQRKRTETAASERGAVSVMSIRLPCYALVVYNC
jgi:hypothetical protein